MRLAVSDRPISRVGIDAETPFTIKGTGKAFKILSSNLYKDKILAIVRELSTNAYDAQVDAGRAEQPIRVHLPNALEPFFAVEDDGLGLSHQSVLTVFSTYFESTKTESNDVMGCLGLGSKSPFCYVDSFTVESRFEGELRTYAVFMNEASHPVVTQIGEAMTTDRCNGVRVMLAVDMSRDYSAFSQAAAKVYEFFPVKPDVSGYAGFTIDQAEILLQGTGWALRANNPHMSRGPRAIMGTIAYPIDDDQVGIGNGLDYAASRQQQRVCALALDITFPLGALEFTAGREDLSYDQAVTVPALRARFKEIGEELQNLVNKMFVDCKTEVEARRLYARVIGSGSLNGVVTSVWWQGRLISHGNIELDLKSMPDTEIRHFHKYYNDTRSILYTKATPHRSTVSLDLSDGIRFIMDDLPRGAQSRIKALPSLGRGVYLITPGTHRQAIEQKLAGLLIELASSLDKLPTKPRTKTTVRKFTRWTRCTGDIRAEYTEECEVDFSSTTGGYYLVTKHTVPVDFDGHYDFTQFYTSMVRLGLFAPKDETIAIVPATMRDPFDEHADWILLNDTLTDLAKAGLTNLPAAQAYAGSRAFAEFKTYAGSDLITRVMTRIAKSLDPGHPFREFTDAYAEQAKIKAQYDDIEQVATRCGITLPLVSSYDFTATYTALIGKYRMLDLINDMGSWRVQSPDAFEALIDYVKMVDAN